MSNENWTRYACPKCAEIDLDVHVLTFARMTFDENGEVDGTDTTESQDGNHEWNEDSIMACRACGHTAKASEFEQPEPDEDDDDADAYCSCYQRSWYGPEHDSACHFAGKPRWFACANCGLEHPTEELAAVENVLERVAPGETMPYGQCQACGSLCYPKGERERASA